MRIADYSVTKAVLEYGKVKLTWFEEIFEEYERMFREKH